MKVELAIKQGAHPVDGGTGKPQSTPVATFTYRPIEWVSFETPDSSLANSRVELLVGLGNEQNNPMLADTPAETHLGVRVYKPGSDDFTLWVFIPRWTLPARQFQEATRYERGLNVETVSLLRRVYRPDVTSSRQQGPPVGESLAPPPIAPAHFPARPPLQPQAPAKTKKGAKKRQQSFGRNCYVLPPATWREALRRFQGTKRPREFRDEM